MLLLSAVLLVAALGLLAVLRPAARSTPGEPQPSAWWLDAIEGARKGANRPT